MTHSPDTTFRPLGELLSPRAKWIIFLTLLFCMFVSTLDQFIVATATPHIVGDLGGFDQLSWVFTTYLLASTVVMPLVGKLSDMFGSKPFLMGGIIIFLAGSLGCGLAQSMPELITSL